jgi:hypothetical protein
MSASFEEYEDAKEDAEGTVPESVIPESLQLFQHPQLIIPETQVQPSFPLRIFPASLFDSIISPSIPEAITHNSLDPPPLSLRQDKAIQETNVADCQSFSEDSADELLERVKVIVQCSTESPRGKSPGVAASARSLIVDGSVVLDVARRNSSAATAASGNVAAASTSTSSPSRRNNKQPASRSTTAAASTSTSSPSRRNNKQASC